MSDKTVTAEREALLPCPHCGDGAALCTSPAIFAGQHYPDYPGQVHGYRIECAGNCHSMTCWWHTADEARTAWDRRFIDQHSQPACDRAERMEKALQEIKLRLHFAGWPAEPMWDAGEEGRPRWIADWRYEIDMLENALNGSERRYPERPHSVPRNQLPATPQPAGMDVAVDRALIATVCDGEDVQFYLRASCIVPASNGEADEVCTDSLAREVVRTILTAAGLPALVAEVSDLKSNVRSALAIGLEERTRAARAEAECERLRAEASESTPKLIVDAIQRSREDLCEKLIAAESRAEQAESEVAALREGNRLHDAIVLPATIANERELIERAEQAEQAAGDWVLIEDRLPEANAPVALIDTSRWENTSGFDRHVQDCGYLHPHEYWSVRGQRAQSIDYYTHWRPLPPPPTQEGGGNG